MKLRSYVLIGLCIVLAAFSIVQEQRIVDMQRLETSEKQAGKTAQGVQLVAAKSRCVAQSEKVFALLGYHDIPTGEANPFGDGLTNHYNPELKRCIMLIETENLNGTVSKTLMDADERKQLGVYIWIVSRTKKYRDQKPISCHITPPDKPQILCHSTEEFDDYVNTLMG